MKFKDLLPIGSVVMLRNAQKKIVIMGVMQIKHLDNGTNAAYDYMGVPYPEGYIGKDTGLLFNHENIQEVFFTGYSNEERDNFLKVLQQILDKTDETLNHFNH